jgi:hypothetical protein
MLPALVAAVPCHQSELWSATATDASRVRIMLGPLTGTIVDAGCCPQTHDRAELSPTAAAKATPTEVDAASPPAAAAAGRCGHVRERHRLTPDTGDRGDRYQSTVFAAVTLPHHPYRRKVPVKVSVMRAPTVNTQKSPWPFSLV